MTTLMQWGNSEGIQGRCDAKCHNATGPDCSCMCGGRYHGGAVAGDLGERVERFGEEVLEQARERAKAEGYELTARNIGELVEGLTGQRELFT